MKNYFLSNGNFYFINNSENEFSSKWLGLSSPEKHYIDYIAVKVKDKWLSGPPKKFFEKNSGVIYNYENAKQEFYFDPDFVMKVKTRKKSSIELGINMHKIYSDESETYKIIKKKNTLKINELLIKFKNLKLESYFYKTHFPGALTNRYNFFETSQKCLVLVFSGKGNMQLRVKLKGKKNAKGLKRYYFENAGFIAGLPLFPQLWARDFCLCSKTLIKSRLRKEVKKTLLVLKKFQKKSGEIPMKIQDSKAVYGSLDSTPLYIISCLELKDKSFNSSVKKALSFYNPFLRGFTWMDTIDRKGLPVEVAAFWYKAFKLASSKFKNRIYKIRLKQFKKITSFYNTKDYFYDALPDNKMTTANPLFLLLYADLNKKTALKLLKKLETPAFLTNDGLRAYSSENCDFDPNSYHKGLVWPFLTNLLILAELKYNRKNSAKKLLKIQKRIFEKDYPELINRGSFFQLWSEALFKYALRFF